MDACLDPWYSFLFLHHIVIQFVTWKCKMSRMEIGLYFSSNRMLCTTSTIFALKLTWFSPDLHIRNVSDVNNAHGIRIRRI